MERIKILSDQKEEIISDINYVMDEEESQLDDKRLFAKKLSQICTYLEKRYGGLAFLGALKCKIFCYFNKKRTKHFRTLSLKNKTNKKVR